MKSGENGKYPEDIQVSICKSYDKICVIEVGQTIEFDLTFVAPFTADRITPYIEASWSWWTPSKSLEIAEDDKIACNSITTLDGAPGCPVIAGHKYNYKMKVPVQSLPLHGIDVDVDFNLNSHKGPISCFAFKASLK